MTEPKKYHVLYRTFEVHQTLPADLPAVDTLDAIIYNCLTLDVEADVSDGRNISTVSREGELRTRVGEGIS